MPVAKICGLRTVEAAEKALDNGAEMLGVIAVPNKTRTVEHHVAESISELVRRRRELNEPHTNILGLRTPLLVGVFMNQPLEEVKRLQKELSLDLVQLHGGEPAEWYEEIPVPVIKRFTPGTSEFSKLVTGEISNPPGLVLVDTESGGTGRQVDWSDLTALSHAKIPYLLAGGLTPENISKALTQPGIWGVDVSSGVETNGVKDLDKIEAFLHNVHRSV